MGFRGLGFGVSGFKVKDGEGFRVRGSGSPVPRKSKVHIHDPGFASSGSYMGCSLNQGPSDGPLFRIVPYYFEDLNRDPNLENYPHYGLRFRVSGIGL